MDRCLSHPCESVMQYYIVYTDIKKARDAGAAPTVGLASLQMVAVLTPVHTYGRSRRHSKGFRQSLYREKPIIEDSREFVNGIKVCPNL